MPHAPSAYTLDSGAMSLPSSGFAPSRRHRAASVATSQPFLHGGDASIRSAGTDATAIYDPEAPIPSIEVGEHGEDVLGRDRSGTVATHREPTRNFFHSSFRPPPSKRCPAPVMHDGCGGVGMVDHKLTIHSPPSSRHSPVRPRRPGRHRRARLLRPLRILRIRRLQKLIHTQQH